MKIPLSLVFLFLSLGAFAVVSGTAMTNKFVDTDSAYNFLLFATAFLFLATGAMILLRRWSRRRAYAYLWFWSLSLNVGLTSILVAITLPLLGMNGLFSLSTYILGVYFFAILAYQLWKANSNFTAAWKKYHRSALSTCYDTNRSVIDTRPLMRLLRLGSATSLSPRQEFRDKFILGIFIVSLSAGINLRHLFPVLSVILSGLPLLTVIALLSKWTFFPLLIARKIRALERIAGEHIAPMT
jgi:hypothetical protein